MLVGLVNAFFKVGWYFIIFTKEKDLFYVYLLFSTDIHLHLQYLRYKHTALRNLWMSFQHWKHFFSEFSRRNVLFLSHFYDFQLYAHIILAKVKSKLIELAFLSS